MNIETEYLYRVLCVLAFKLDNEMLEHEESLLDSEDEDEDAFITSSTPPPGCFTQRSLTCVSSVSGPGLTC